MKCAVTELLSCHTLSRGAQWLRAGPARRGCVWPNPQMRGLVFPQQALLWPHAFLDFVAVSEEKGK